MKKNEDNYTDESAIAGIRNINLSYITDFKDRMFQSANEIVTKLYEIVDTIPGRILDLQNADGEHDTIYGFDFDEYTGGDSREMKVYALGIFDGTLCVLMDTPPAFTKLKYTMEDYEESDLWKSLDNTSDIYFIQTVYNIAEFIYEYVE